MSINYILTDAKASVFLLQRTFTKTYAEQLREEGYSEQGIEHFVKESEANRTSPNAAAEHAMQLVNEMNHKAYSIILNIRLKEYNKSGTIKLKNRYNNQKYHILGKRCFL